MGKRWFDILFSLAGLIVLLPVFVLISLLILLDTPGGVFFFQHRVGKNNVDFRLVKFRTMRRNAHRKGLITIGQRDRRITRTGYYLRRYKLDELPQLINVLLGQMSLVGPRPEVRRYVDLSDPRQRRVLTIRPGITGYASLEFVRVNELLAKSDDPERTYREEVLPRKLELNLRYLEEKSLVTDLNILFKTLVLLCKNL